MVWKRLFTPHFNGTTCYKTFIDKLDFCIRLDGVRGGAGLNSHAAGRGGENFLKSDGARGGAGLNSHGAGRGGATLEILWFKVNINMLVFRH
jgi:hypothetical protein